MDSKTGSMAFRLALVQPPNTTATSSFWISLRAFSAKVGQSEAPSSMIISNCLPRTPPEALISSMAITLASFTAVSEIDMVPEREWRIPTFMVPDSSISGASAAVSTAAAGAAAGSGAAELQARMPNRDAKRIAMLPSLAERLNCVLTNFNIWGISSWFLLKLPDYYWDSGIQDIGNIG